MAMDPSMHLSEIRTLVDRRPFQPFRICMTGGREYVVRNPDFVFLMRHTVILGVPLDSEDLPEHSVYCDPVHITRIEPVLA